MTLLLNISVPRTGSTHLNHHLRALSGMQVFDEVFNPNKSFSIKPEHLAYIADRWGKKLNDDTSDDKTVKWVRSHPTEMFELFEHFAGERTASVKIFPRHLDRKYVINTLLPRTDIVSLVLYRRVIDSYASAEKARQNNSWREIDTTGMQVTGNVKHFRGWARHQQAWYAECRTAIEGAGQPFNVLRYDEHLDRGSEKLFTTLEAFLQSSGIDPGQRGPMKYATEKQDASPDYSTKFANWDEFSAGLDKAGLLDLATGYFD